MSFLNRLLRNFLFFYWLYKLYWRQDNGRFYVCRDAPYWVLQSLVYTLWLQMRVTRLYDYPHRLEDDTMAVCREASRELRLRRRQARIVAASSVTESGATR